ncbi:MAG TPA: hypothetical protein VKB51_11470, partial [bacterium]|nr:hypothetical protein [bacterium]
DPASSGGLHNISCSGAVATGTEGTITFSKSGFGQLNWTSGGGYLLLPGASTLTSVTSYSQLIAALQATGRRFHGMHMQPWQSTTGGAYDTMDVTFVVGAGNYAANAIAAAPYTDVLTNQVDTLNGGDITPAASGTVQSSGPIGVMDNSTVVGTSGARILATQLDGRWVIFGIDSMGPNPQDWETFYLVEDSTVYTPMPTPGSDGPYVFNDGSGPSNVNLDLTNGTWVHDDGSTVQEWGTLQQLSNGFLKLVLQQSTQPDTTAPTTFAAMELPGSLLQVFMTDPQTGIQSAQTGVIAGTCPDAAAPTGGTVSYNVMTVPNEIDPILDISTTGADNESYGTADLSWDSTPTYTVTPTGANWNLLADGSTITTPSGLTSGTCGSGNIAFGATTTSMAFLPNGLAHVQDSNSGVDGNLLMLQDGTTPDATVQYRGWAMQGRYDSGSTSWRSEATPIWAEPGTTAGTLLAGPYTDVLNNVKDTVNSGTVDLSSSGTSGMYGAGQVTTPSGTMPFPFMVMTDTLTGKKMLYGVAYDSSANTAQQSNWQSIFLFQQ